MKSTIASIIAFGLAALLAPAEASNYTFIDFIPIPASPDNLQPGGVFNAFDISYFDPSTQLDYVADRSNASVDIFSATNDTFVGRIGGSGNLFSGETATTSTSGPNGVQVINLPGQHQVYAGNGPSTLLGFNIVSPTNNPQFTNPPVNTGGALRVDEMSFDPNTKRILAANNADSPGFMTLIDAKTGVVIKKITFDIPPFTPMGGVEASTYNAKTGTFFVAIPALQGGQGGIAEIDPKTGIVLRVIDLSQLGVASISPTGIAAAANGQIMVGDGNNNGQSIIIDPTGAGPAKIITTFQSITGVDQVWFDPTTGRWFLAAGTNPLGRAIAVVDSLTDTVLQNIPTVGNAHSVSVDPISGKVFVPLPASNPLINFTNPVCSDGCIAVFEDISTAVPEPSTWAMMLLGFAGLGFAFRRSRVSFA
jgi:hypothetical protein